MVEKTKRFRIDFKPKIVETKKNEDGSATYVMEFIPDPKRYQLTTRNGEEGYWSEHDQLFIPLEDFKKAWKTMGGMPIYYNPLEESDFRQYLEKARNELLDNWDIKYNLPKEAQISDIFLENATDNVLQFVILYVDLAGSTKLSSELNINIYSKIIKIFLMQMAKVVNNSRGYVLKYVGDCVIGYFPAETNYISMCDNAIMAATLMRIVVENVINPVFISKGFPQIGFHVGIDVGEAKVIDIGAKGISRTQDILGEVMNLTAKIQDLTGINEIMIGENVYHLIHCNWQEMCSEVRLPETWKHISKDTGEKYKVYKFTPSSAQK